MSAEHMILAAIFAVLFIVPLAWLFLVDRTRRAALPDELASGGESPATAAPAGSLD